MPETITAVNLARQLTEARSALASYKAHNAELLAALEACGAIREKDGWHLRDCRIGKRRGGMPPENCSARCATARATIAKAGYPDGQAAVGKGE